MKIYFVYIVFLLSSIGVVSGQNICFDKLASLSAEEFEQRDSISLNEISCELVNSFQLQNGASLAIYDAAFYLHSNSMKQEDLNKFRQNVIQDALNRTSNYILFIRNESQDNVAKTEVILDLPNPNNLSCLSIPSQLLLADELTLLFDVENERMTFREIQYNAILNLKNYIEDQLRTNCSGFSVSSNQKDFFRRNGFDSVSVTVEDILLLKENVEVDKNLNTIFDSLTIGTEKKIFWTNRVNLISEGEDFDFVAHFYNELLNLPEENGVRAYYTDNSVFELENREDFIKVTSDALLEDGKTKIWLHAYDNNDGSVTAYIKFILEDNYYSEYYPPPIADGKNYGKYILADGVVHSTFSTELEDAEIVAASLNKIFRSHYGIEYNLFEVEHIGQVTFRVKKSGLRAYQTLWHKEDNFRDEDNFVFKINTLCGNGFDWDVDRYTKVIFDAFNVNKNILFKFKDGDGSVEGTTLEDVKGYTGKYYTKGFIYLSDSFKYETDIRWTWSPGGTFMHEYISHISHVGLREIAHEMQDFYDFANSRINHEGSPIMVFDNDELDRLDILRENCE